MTTKRDPDFLGEGETVISSLERDTREIYVTNWRLIDINKTQDKKTRTFQDFTYKHISHIHCVSARGSDYRYLGAMGIILGLLLFLLNGILAVVCLIGGVIAFIYKSKLQSVLKIYVVGRSDPVTITLAVSASKMDSILTNVADMRQQAGD